MTTCIESGALRAYLDEELSAGDSQAVREHLATCAACQATRVELVTLDGAVRAHLQMTAASGAGTPDTEAALARLRTQLVLAPMPTGASRRSSAFARARRPLFGGAVAAALLLAVLLVPSARAAAGQLLGIFRAQSVVFVQVSPGRLQQLENLRGNAGALFLSPPQQVGAAPTQQQVSTLAEAQALVPFTPQAPTTLPAQATSTTYTVQGQASYQVQVNVATLRQILAALGVTDVSIPDALGAQPITATLPPALEEQYQGADYRLQLIQGISPTVSLPAGVSLQQLGKAALEVYGLSPQQADSLSRHIDWASTLVFPFPTGTNTIEQVTVHGVPGILLDASAGSQTQSIGSMTQSSSSQQQVGSAPTQQQPHYLVYWQQGHRFFVLVAQGRIGAAGVLAVASSVR
jgi:Putative zinc-finger